MPNRKHIFTEGQLSYIKEQIESGTSMNKIAVNLGVSSYVVNVIVREKGWAKPKKNTNTHRNVVFNLPEEYNDILNRIVDETGFARKDIAKGIVMFQLKQIENNINDDMLITISEPTIVHTDRHLKIGNNIILSEPTVVDTEKKMTLEFTDY